MACRYNKIQLLGHDWSCPFLFRHSEERLRRRENPIHLLRHSEERSDVRISSTSSVILRSVATWESHPFKVFIKKELKRWDPHALRKRGLRMTPWGQMRSSRPPKTRAQDDWQKAPSPPRKRHPSKEGNGWMNSLIEWEFIWWYLQDRPSCHFGGNQVRMKILISIRHSEERLRRRENLILLKFL